MVLIIVHFKLSDRSGKFFLDLFDRSTFAIISLTDIIFLNVNISTYLQNVFCHQNLKSFELNPSLTQTLF